MCCLLGCSAVFWVLIGLPDSKDEGTTVVQNTGNYLLDDAE